MKVSIYESLPRDGLQEIAKFIPTEQKIEVLKRIIDLGFKKIDALSFAHPKWVPQFADVEAVTDGILPYAKEHGVILTASTLNRKAVERAIAANVDTAVWCASVSEKYSQRNTRKSIADTYVDTEQILTEFKNDIHFDMSIMCALLSLRMSLKCAFRL